METVKIIGRISKEGKEYLQTVINTEGGEHKFIPVFLKKGITELHYKEKERKVDKRGEVYTLYTVPAKDVFMPKNEDGQIERAIITK